MKTHHFSLIAATATIIIALTVNTSLSAEDNRQNRPTLEEEMKALAPIVKFDEKPKRGLHTGGGNKAAKLNDVQDFYSSSKKRWTVLRLILAERFVDIQSQIDAVSEDLSDDVFEADKLAETKNKLKAMIKKQIDLSVLVEDINQKLTTINSRLDALEAGQ